MNTADHQWEADIRQKVEQHEFDFDPQAWDAMEQLLDASGDIPPGSDNRNRADWNWWKVLLIGLALGLLLFLLIKPNRIDDQLLGSFNVQISNNETVPKSISSTTAAADTINIAITDPLPIPRTQKSLLTPAPPTTNIQTEPEKADAPISRPEIVIVAPLERSKKIPLLQRKDTPLDFKIQDPPPVGRRRNRRTLFPDVIPKY